MKMRKYEAEVSNGVDDKHSSRLEEWMVLLCLASVTVFFTVC